MKIKLNTKDILFKPVFITSAGSSGYELLASLLDNHEEIVIMPYTFKFYYIYENLNLVKEKSILKIISKIIKKTKLKRLVEGKYELSNPYWNKENLFNDLSKFNTNIFKRNLNCFSRKQ